VRVTQLSKSVKTICKLVGVDKSKAMLEQAKSVVIPQSTLTDQQKEKVTWREGDLIDPSICSAGEFTHAFLTYFTIYFRFIVD
jgi:chemotaxis methyl-accepting protein methylase